MSDVDPASQSKLTLVREELAVTTRQVDVERVRLRTVVDETPVVVETELENQVIDVERRRIEREVAAAPPPRQDGEWTVFSTVEERAVVEKRLFVVEEVRVRHRAEVRQSAFPTTVRATRVAVERTQVSSGSGDDKE